MARKRTQAQLESEFQSHLVDRIEQMFPGCYVRKHDMQQGWPDLLILFKNKWALLEVKAYEGAPEQPNQGWWVEHFDSMSFAAFIYPENEERVLDDLQQAFRSRQPARVPKR